MNTAPELLKRLCQRQLNMIAIGGVLGAGLFIGSSVGFEAVSIARDHVSHLPSHPVLAVEEQP